MEPFFISSNGEPLLDPKRFLRLAREAAKISVRIITYTNDTTLNRDVLRELEEADVNLVMKLESLNPKNNDKIIFNPNKRRKKDKLSGYIYKDFLGQRLPILPTIIQPILLLSKN